MSVARPEVSAYAQGIRAGIAEERERCIAIIRCMGTGHADNTQSLIQEIERGAPPEDYL
jgi:hypothetical protein